MPPTFASARRRLRGAYAQGLLALAFAATPWLAKPAGALPPNPIAIQAMTISASTGEKPQAKVWTHAGSWWCVLPNSTGTWLRRLDGTAWTDVLKLTNATNSKADVKSIGNVAHVLLFEGVTSELVSVEYVPATNSYQPWSSRPAVAPVSLDNGVEIATIDVDSQGRMWLAADGSTTVTVRHSDPPYASWSTPITLASNITADDIAVVTAFPNGKIGVLWSNQTTQRFGFRTHVDGNDPTTWSADEVPASQSALNVGAGMADDHLNVAVASDGTLYAAVKTSYDTPGYPKVALLVRRPAGTWDNLYEVDQSGTRGIVLLNEQSGTVSVVYTASEGFNPIVYKETATSSVAFGPRATLFAASLNDCSSTKQKISSSVVILASSASSAFGVLCGTVAGPPTITSASPLPNGTVGSLYGTTLAADDGTSPYLWAITQGTLQSGLTFDAATAHIGGTPEVAETQTFTIRVTDAASLSDEQSFDLTIDPGPLAVDAGEVPLVDALQSAWPNPLRDVCTVEYRLGNAGRVELGVFALDGRHLRTLVREVLAPGVHHVTWDGRDDSGSRVAAGMCFVQLQTEFGRCSRAVVVLN